MTAGRINRFQFLRGDFSGRQAVHRPPWAVDESRFVNQCDRCQACIQACPEKILIKGRGGFPEVDFSRGECTFCRHCVDACEPAALEGASPEPWQLYAEISESCLALQGVVCRTCAEQCEQAAIRFRPVIGGGSVPMLFQEQCNGCGACVSPCPARAIHMGTPHAREESVA